METVNPIPQSPMHEMTFYNQKMYIVPAQEFDELKTKYNALVEDNQRLRALNERLIHEKLLALEEKNKELAQEELERKNVELASMKLRIEHLEQQTVQLKQDIEQLKKARVTEGT